MRIAYIHDVPVAAPPDAVGYKYADGIEPAAWIYDQRELDALLREAPRMVSPVVNRDAVSLRPPRLVIDVKFTGDRDAAEWGPFEARVLTERAVVGLACRVDVIEARIRQGR